MRLADLGDGGIVGGSLDTRPEQVWLVRPDAHTAACVSTPEDLVAAARRVLGF